MPHDSDADDAKLLQDRRIDVLLAKYEPIILGRCIARLNGDLAAEDVAQNVLLRLSGCCSRIFASHSFVLPPTLATQCRRVSSFCSTCSTPSMNSGKSSNCVHWLYVVETGTSTSIDSVIVRGVVPPLRLVASADHAGDPRRVSRARPRRRQARQRVSPAVP